MKRFRLPVLYFVSLSALLAFNLQCGGLSKKKIADVENRIKLLESKGVPDSVIAGIKVHIYNYNTAKKLGQSSDASKLTDSVLNSIAASEKWYQDFITQNKSAVLSSVSSIQSQKANFSGLQLRAADSMIKIIDSMVKGDLIVDAKTEVSKTLEIMPNLQKEQELANTTKPMLIGKWKDVHSVKAEEGNFRYTETTFYNFKNDGSFEGSEERKGQSSPFFKEDWQFLSWGNYDLKGDTVFLFVTREKCPRQNYTQLDLKTKKWIDQKKPTYDSTITNHSKDKSIPFTYIKQTFKKSK